jgi:hypothetical protein
LFSGAQGAGVVLREQLIGKRSVGETGKRIGMGDNEKVAGDLTKSRV